MRRWVEAELRCPYAQYERMKQEAEGCGGVCVGTDYGADVTLRLLLPEEEAERCRARIFDLSGGKIELPFTGEALRAVPL